LTSSFPAIDTVIAVHIELVEALMHVWHHSSAVLADNRSVYYGLSRDQLERRLSQRREELDKWAVMMLVASFEAAVRTDAADRIKRKTKDAIRIPLKRLYDQKKQVSLKDILDLWKKHTTIPSHLETKLNRLLIYRNWLAHGRHWIDKKSGMNPTPSEAQTFIHEYMETAQKIIADFPRG